jgi:beta-lactamase class A
LFAKNLRQARASALNADQPVKTASVIKLPIMLEAFHQVRAGKRSMNEKLVLAAADRVSGSGVLPYLHPGLELTLEDAIVLMMVVSDNTATNLVLDPVGIPAVTGQKPLLMHGPHAAYRCSPRTRLLCPAGV